MENVSWVKAPSPPVKAFTWVSNTERTGLEPHYTGRLIVQEDSGAPALAYEPLTHEWFAVLKTIATEDTGEFALYWDIATLRTLDAEMLQSLTRWCEEAVLGMDVCLTAARIAAAFAHKRGSESLSRTALLGGTAYATGYHRASAKNALSIMDGTTIDEALTAIDVDSFELLYRTIGSHNQQANADVFPTERQGE